MPTMNGSDILHAALRALGVDCIFGIPSQHNLAFYESLRRLGGIRVIGTRHEQGAVHAADGYARATGRLGVAVVSTGPGTTNAMTGLYEAAYASSPVLLLTTQVDTPFLGKGRGYIHDADGQLAMLKAVVRHAECPVRVDDIVPALHRTVQAIFTGRPQPGALEIPTDLLQATGDGNLPAFTMPAPRTPDAAALARAAGLLAAARRPLIWLGGGAQGAAAEVRALAEHLGAPVVSSPNGRGILPHGHPLYLGCHTHLPPFRELLSQADLVLAIGTRFQGLASQFWSLPMPANLVHIDADPRVIGLNFPAAVAIEGDAGLAAQKLREATSPGHAEVGFMATAQATRAALDATMTGMVGPDHKAITDIIARLLPADSPVMCDATTTGNTWGNYLLPIRTPRRAFYSTGYAIGPALPVGLGAAVGTESKTLVIHGDGGIMLNIAELATAADAKIPAIVCVFNNGGYGGLKALQQHAGVPPYGGDLLTPDFVTLARSMGVPGRQVATVADFESAFAEALAVEGPFLIETDLTALAPVRLLA
ncbi:MAG: thiamine pyrophosphate-binding protein [Proteobacteria bacterium]|nr:thiamine pyrophosphate-binding protein [Pseudomonadota bacterium]HQR04240.1 thiamine pyrophosphate-binding protein [Rhodocyclaceae bacterium]